MRAQHFPAQDGDAVHVYSRPGTIILQLRRNTTAENDPKKACFKVAVSLTTGQALAVASELLTAANGSIAHAASQPAAPTAKQ